jgi:hypothetical protein
MRRAKTNLLEYPMLNIIVSDHDVHRTQSKIKNIGSQTPSKQEDDGREGWICGRGIAIKRKINDGTQCFCPPSLYGEYCQYFSDRIVVIISFDNIPTELLEQETDTIKILAMLLSNDSIIDHHVFHLPWIFSGELNKKFRFNLIHHRPKLLFNSYKVQFEAYHLSSDSSIKFVAIWEYPIKFPFLPSYRLLQILKFENTQRSMNETHICEKSNPCLHNSTCHSIMNKINHTSSYYCHCNNQTFGKHCQHFLQSMKSPQCSKTALLRPLSTSKSICLCPFYSYGPTCYLNHTCFNRNPCGINRGKCHINRDSVDRDYICVCNREYFGDHCEYNSALVRINFTDFSFVESPLNYTMSSIIQLCDLHNETLDLIIRTKYVYQGLPPSITDVYHRNHYLPRIGILKLYHKLDIKQPDYFLLYSFLSDIPRINLTLVINVTNYCLYTPTRFQKNLSNASHLSDCKISVT